mgnify:FL=1
MEWVRLRDIGKIVTGNTPPTSKPEFYGDYMPFIKATDISLDSKTTLVTEQSYSKRASEKYKESLVPKGSTCVVTIGSIGKKMTYAHKDLFVNQAINAIIPSPKYDNEYIYYNVKYSVLPQLKKLDSGTTSGRENVSKSSFSNIRIPIVKDKNIQHRIASILSTYDSLIENNTKRIRLLEKMAENLYKEWFVRFRFPGHENVEMENGLPKGWSRGSLSDVCEFKRGKNITSSEMEEGNVPVISAGLEPSGYHSCSNVRGVNVTMSSSGANAGYIAIHYSDIWAADCSYIKEATTDNIYYVYELLNNIRNVINNFQRGAAQPHVYPKDVNRIKLILPSKELMLKANGRLEIMHNEIYNFQKQNSLLARQRDLLLPRLMSGKLEVKVKE